MRALSKSSIFMPFLLLRWQEAILIEARFLLNSAKALPTLCVKASAQKASRAKVQKKKINLQVFFKVCTAGIELATARPKRMQALCLPL
jgi:hypothetical protein